MSSNTNETRREPSEEDKAKLEQLRLAYVKAQQNNSPDLDKAREAYQDFAVKLLVSLSGKLDPPPGPDPGADPGYVKPGGWGSTDKDANNWKAIPMVDTPQLFKVVDKAGVNVATNFKSLDGALAYIDAAKKVPSGCPTGQHLDPATGKCVVDGPAPAGDKDQFGVLKIYKDKPGGETNTTFKLETLTRHYASGKASEDSCEYTATASSPEHNSDVEFTCYEHINSFKTNEPDTISDKLTGPPHQDGAKSWVIAEFMTDGSAKATYETESPHPTYQKIDPKPATSIGGSIVGKWFGHKHITYVKDGARWVETWIHFPVKDINNIGAEQDGWRQYVKPFKVGAGFTKANGKLTTSRLDGIKVNDPPNFKYTSVREITPP
jgi:hypothetical protein